MLMANLPGLTAALLIAGALLSPTATAQEPSTPLMQDPPGDVILFDTQTPYSGPGAELVDLINVWAWIDGPHLKVEMQLASLENADAWTTVPLSSINYLVYFIANQTEWEVRVNHQLLTGLGEGPHPWNYYFGYYNDPESRKDINGTVEVGQGKWNVEVPLKRLNDLTNTTKLSGFYATAFSNHADATLFDTVATNEAVALPPNIVPSENESPESTQEPSKKMRNVPAVGIWAPFAALALASVLGRHRIGQ